jgi:hypothetical protein
MPVTNRLSWSHRDDTGMILMRPVKSPPITDYMEEVRTLRVIQEVIAEGFTRRIRILS